MKLHQNSALSIWLMCRFNKTEGLTLIEFLAVLLAIGVLVAVALPPLLSSTDRAMKVEGKNYVGAMNRAQQAYFEENKGALADYMEKLGLGIKPEEADYRFLIRRTERAAFHYAISKKPNLKSYAGAVWKATTDINGIKEETTRTIVCEANKPATTKPVDPVYTNGGYVCGEGTVQLGV